MPNIFLIIFDNIFYYIDLMIIKKLKIFNNFNFLLIYFDILMRFFVFWSGVGGLWV